MDTPAPSPTSVAASIQQPTGKIKCVVDLIHQALSSFVTFELPTLISNSITQTFQLQQQHQQLQLQQQQSQQGKLLNMGCQDNLLNANLPLIKWGHHAGLTAAMPTLTASSAVGCKQVDHVIFESSLISVAPRNVKSSITSNKGWMRVWNTYIQASFFLSSPSSPGIATLPGDHRRL